MTLETLTIYVPDSKDWLAAIPSAVVLTVRYARYEPSSTTEAKLDLCFIHLMIKRLGAARAEFAMIPNEKILPSGRLESSISLRFLKLSIRASPRGVTHH
jgi:hypothetical protein